MPIAHFSLGVLRGHPNKHIHFLMSFLINFLTKLFDEFFDEFFYKYFEKFFEKFFDEYFDKIVGAFFDNFLPLQALGWDLVYYQLKQFHSTMKSFMQ